MDREPQSGELVPCRLRCLLCQAAHSVALPAEARIRDALASLTCPTCGRFGMRLARPIPLLPSDSARAQGKYSEPPDNEGDDQLLETMAKCRRN